MVITVHLTAPSIAFDLMLRGYRLQPIDGDTMFSLTVEDEEGETVLARLRAEEGVDGAYSKPHDTVPFHPGLATGVGVVIREPFRGDRAQAEKVIAQTRETLAKLKDKD